MKLIWLFWSQRLLSWLRANPLGPALTVTLTGLAVVFVLPQLTLLVVDAPRFVLAEVLLGALVVPYATYRVHGGSPRVLAILWALVYLVGFLRAPASLRVMHALAVSAHLSAWIMIGFGMTAIYGLIHVSRSRPKALTTPTIYDRMAESPDRAG